MHESTHVERWPSLPDAGHHVPRPESAKVLNWPFRLSDYDCRGLPELAKFGLGLIRKVVRSYEIDGQISASPWPQLGNEMDTKLEAGVLRNGAIELSVKGIKVAGGTSWNSSVQSLERLDAGVSKASEKKGGIEASRRGFASGRMRL